MRSVEVFIYGVDDAVLAPTAVNQQKFKFRLLDNGKVKASAGLGFFSKVDLGIVKCHFEIGAGVKSAYTDKQLLFNVNVGVRFGK